MSAFPEVVLLVDDDDFVRSILVRQLSAAGVRKVLSAPDAQLALFHLRQNEDCRLIICDLDLPGADGDRLLTAMGELRPGMPTVLISSLAAPIRRGAENIAMGAGLKLLGSLPKPVEVGALSALLRGPGSPAGPVAAQ
jgi:DNA-binding NtrC family response regulator